MTGDSEAAYLKIHSAANSNPAMASWASRILFTAELISPRSSAEPSESKKPMKNCGLSL